MANIATLLARILSTRYGNEMRQDLHDAIEAVNDDTETALGKKLTFTNNTRKLKLLANDDTVLSEVVISGGSGSGSVDSVNGLFPDDNGNVELNLDDINDVDITSAADGQILKYDATLGKWVNGTGGGGTSDYTDLTNKPQINGVTLSGNKTSSDLGISGGSNENLLLNPWFNVNTKGFTSGTALNYYSKECIDSWFGSYDYPADSSGTITYNSNGSITIAPSYNEGYSGMIGITQAVKNKNELYGKTITLSVLINGSTLLSTSGVFAQGSGISDYHLLFGNNMRASLTFSDSNGNFTIRVGREDNTQSGESSVVINAVKLEVGSASTLTSDLKPNQNLETVKCNGVMRSNRNLLDNPWFTVNQRNKSGTIGVIGYFLDRWKLDSGTITIESNGTVSIGARTIVAEYIEQNVVGKQVTVSALLSDASIKKATFTVLADTYNSGSDGVLSLVVDTRSSVQSNGSKAKIVLYNTDFDNAITIQSVKLELGTESTLALDVAPDYATELMKCQRYFYPLGGGSSDEIHLYMGRVFQTSLGENRSQATIVLPTAMRTTPTFNGVIIGNDFNGNSSNLTSVDVKGVQNINISGAWGSTPTYGAGYIQFGYANQLSYLSAEL